MENKKRVGVSVNSLTRIRTYLFEGFNISAIEDGNVYLERVVVEEETR